MLIFKHEGIIELEEVLGKSQHFLEGRSFVFETVYCVNAFIKKKKEQMVALSINAFVYIIIEQFDDFTKCWPSCFNVP